MAEDKKPSKLDEIYKKFKQERTAVSQEIREDIEKMNSLKGLREVQINMLSRRQRLLESNHTLIEHITALRKKYRNARGKHMEDISTNHQTRYQYNEKSVIIDGKTTAIKESMDLVENQISFYTESIKTVDNVLYGIKTRVELDKVLGI